MNQTSATLVISFRAIALQPLGLTIGDGSAGARTLRCALKLAVEFEDLEHVNFMRDFLAKPERFLRHLCRDDD